MESKISLALHLIEENLASKKPFLDLGNCGLTDSSTELNYLVTSTHLKSLSLGTSYFNNESAEVNTDNKGEQNTFVSIPRWLPQSLLELQMRNTGVTSINEINMLVNLQLLDLSLNKIEKIENVEVLAELTELALHGNFISKIENISRLPKLEILHLTRNKITRIENLEGLSKLKQLLLSANNIGRIENLQTLAELSELDLNRNEIAIIENLDNNPKLTFLNLNYNKLKRIENLDNLPNLLHLNLEYNEISKIENLERLTSLQHLTLDNNNITRLENLELMGKIDFLGLDKNKISKIENLEKVIRLKNLYLSDNRINKIENLEALTKLEKFYFPRNEVEEIEPLVRLTTLKEVYCFSNPIKDCPADVWQTNDITQIRAHFEKKAIPAADIAAPLPAKDVKLILLGNSGTGKTNLVHYLQTGIFLKERDSTHGLEVKRWIPDKNRYPLLKDINISIWDFGGQEYYHEAYRLFLSANAVYVILWDKDFDKNFRKKTKVTNDKEEMLEHFEKRYWLDTVRHYSENKETSPLVLVQNKTDQLSDKSRISQDLFNEYGLKECYHISIKEGCNEDNIQQVRILQNFERDMESILADAADKTEIKPVWQTVRHEIIALQENGFDPANSFTQFIEEDTWIDINNFNTVCKQLAGNQLSDEDIYTLPRWLDKCGAVVYFEKNIHLNDKVFISPKKLSEKLYQVLNKEVLKNNGEFSKINIEGTEGFKTTFIEAAKDLNLIFPHPHRADHFIAPQYLPAEHAIEDLFKIASSNAWQDSFWIKVPLFYYKKLLNYLILTYVGDATTTARYFWKHGIVFIKNELRIIIKGLYPEENQTEGILLIGVENGNNKKDIQRDIFQVIFNYGNEGKKDSTTEQFKIKTIGSAVTEREATKTQQMDNKFLKNIKISYDGESYESYDNLKVLSEKAEQFFINNETKVRLLLNRFSHILPFTVNVKPPKKIFVSYSHQNTAWLNKLRIHLSGLKHSGLIEEWTDQEILAGERWDKKIKDSMEQADVFICLLSADFVASDYIWNTELKNVFEALKSRNAQVVFIYIEPFDLGSIKGAKINDNLTETTILDFEIIPKDENEQLKPASLWANENLALATIVKRIRRAIESR